MMTEKNEQLDFGRSHWGANREYKHFLDCKEKLQSAVNNEDIISIIEVLINDLSFWRKGLKSRLDKLHEFYAIRSIYEISHRQLLPHEFDFGYFARPIIGQREFYILLESDELRKDIEAEYELNECKSILATFQREREELSKKIFFFKGDFGSQDYQSFFTELEKNLKSLRQANVFSIQVCDRLAEKLNQMRGIKSSGLPKSQKDAYESYDWAEKRSGLSKDKDVYGWLKENPFEEYELPSSFDTWKNYLSKARTYYGMNKNTHRAGRSTNITKAKDDPELLEGMSNQYKV